MRLRVMTYNIRWGMGIDGRFSLERIADLIRDAGADLVGLQEVECGSPRSRFRSAPGVLARQLGMHVVFGSNLRLGTWRFGNALLSRFPITSWQNVPLPPLPNGAVRVGAAGRRTPVGSAGCAPGTVPHVYHRLTPTRVLRRCFPGLFDRRGLLLAEVVPAPSLALRCAVTHLPLNHAVRREHARRILDRLQAIDGPALLLGDFNEGPLGPSVTQLCASGLLSNLSGEAATFPSSDPCQKLDYILGTPGLELVGKPRVIPSPASDHLAVVVDVEVGVACRGVVTGDRSGSRHEGIDFPGP